MSESISPYILENFAFLRGVHITKYGVHWSIQQSWKNTMRFSSFYRFSDDKGVGRKALEEVCALADRHRIDLSLFTEFPKLISYYESFGFVKDETRSDPENWEGFRRHVSQDCFWDMPTPIAKHMPPSNFWKAVTRHDPKYA